MRTPDTHHAHAAGSRNQSARSGVRTNNSRARVVSERGRVFPSSQDGERNTVAINGRRGERGRRYVRKWCIVPSPPGTCPLPDLFLSQGEEEAKPQAACER